MRGNTNAVVNSASGINIHDTQGISGQVQDLDLQTFSDDLVNFTGNYTNTKVTRATRVIDATISASWTTVSGQSYKAYNALNLGKDGTNPKVLSTDRPVISLNTSGMTAEQVKTANRMFGFIDRAVTSVDESGNGIITFYCYNKIPNVALPIQIKGF